MSIGDDAVGQFADATLIGASLGHGGGGSQHHDEHCANCGAALTGRYCQACGQRGHLSRSVLHLAEEFFHGLFHLDGKIWRTAPLLFFRPGALTRRYVEGKRVRYISPIGLFLFSIFLMFLAVASIESSPAVNAEVNMSPADRAQLKEDLGKARAEIDRATGNPEAVGAVKNALDKAEKATEGADKKEEDADKDDDNDPDGIDFSKPLGLDWRALSKKLSKKSGYSGLGPEVEKRIRASLADPDLLVFKLRSAASEFSFLLVPLSVPFLWLMFFWRRRVYLYDHVIFSLHSLSFMALFVTLFIVAMELPVKLGALPGIALGVIPPMHMFFHLKGTYGLGIFGALWRTCFLSLIAMIVLICYVCVILMLGLLH
jgi:hypothetical protein